MLAIYRGSTCQKLGTAHHHEAGPLRTCGACVQRATSNTHRGSLAFSPLNIFVPKARVNAEVLVEVEIAIVYKTRKRIVT